VQHLVVGNSASIPFAFGFDVSAVASLVSMHLFYVGQILGGILGLRETGTTQALKCMYLINSAYG